MPPSCRFPPLREGNRASVPPARRGNLKEGVFNRACFCKLCPRDWYKCRCVGFSTCPPPNLPRGRGRNSDSFPARGEGWGGVSNEGAHAVRPFHRSRVCMAHTLRPDTNAITPCGDGAAPASPPDPRPTRPSTQARAPAQSPAEQTACSRYRQVRHQGCKATNCPASAGC